MSVYRWIKDETLPSVRLGKHCYRVRAADVRKLIGR